ncbi:MAG: cache domain-containing protein [Nitrospirae bacterium]|nr:cache domain-containing protein [Nitrospirota bacterium]MBF0534083.1 cache domain-containing protein [Nitrospirota bacterium]MBF0616242.1 cache domain-containing protein [Nitrospirota bacterium]
MKIRNLLILITAAIIIISMASVTSVAVFTIKKQGQDDVEKYKAEELAKVRHNLKDLVYMAYGFVEKNDKTAHDKNFIEKYYGVRLKDAISIVEPILVAYANMAKENKMTLPQAKKEAFDVIKSMRYDNGTGYFWINDTTLPYPRMIMHPILPELDGKVLTDPKFNCALGKNENLFQAFAEVTQAKGEGFVDYLWPKPKGDFKTLVPKLSYVKLFKEWDIIIGTGIYIDDALKEAMEKSKVDLSNIRYDEGTGYFWINDTTLPYPRMIMHPILPELDGKVLNDPMFENAMNKKQNLFQAIAEACNNKEGEGFVDYRWPKPSKDGLNKPVPKLSFVKVYKPWGWIIGTGVYIDNIEKETARKTLAINEQISKVIRKFLLISLVVLIAGITAVIIISKTLTVPISRLANSIRKIKKEGIYSGESPVAGTVETKELGEIFNSMLSDLKNSDATNKALMNKLSDHNRTLEQKVAERTSELQNTLTKVREANNKILNGIRYAKIIQGSLLPDRDTVLAHLPNSLFIWMPKDIVSGDIYFTEILEHSYLIAIVDCTGHGVPGAFMTMIASSSLKKIINEDLCHNPAEILKRLNHAVKSLLLTNSEHDLFDVGMDAAVCVLKPRERVLEFSGARLPLYCISDGKVEVLKGDRQSIGYKDSPLDLNFKTEKVKMSDGMSFYLATDGYVDQTGGNYGFSFGNRRFRALLREICKNPFHRQREMLISTFNEHIGNNERLDDVTVIGFSI